MFSLSRASIEPTYMVPGLAAAYLAIPGTRGGLVLPRVSAKLVACLILVSIGTLGALYCWVKVFAV
jgi:hypothetical protein